MLQDIAELGGTTTDGCGTAVREASGDAAGDAERRREVRKSVRPAATASARSGAPSDPGRRLLLEPAGGGLPRRYPGDTGEPDLGPRRAHHPHRGAVRIRLRANREGGRGSQTRCHEEHGPSARRRGRVDVHHHAVLPADAVGGRGQMRHSPELHQHERRRAEEGPARRWASSGHRFEEARVLTHARVRPQPPHRDSVDEAPQDETAASSCRTVTLAASAGRRTTNVAPPPAMHSAQIVPPWASTMRLQM